MRTLKIVLTILALTASAIVAHVPASGQSTPRLQQFVYVLKVTPAFHDQSKWTQKENDAVGRHFERLVEATKAGRVIFAGRTDEALEKTFGLVVFEAEDEPVAKQFMESDPAVVAGVMSATLHPYVLALGGVAGAQVAGPDPAAEATVRALDDQERLAALNQDYAALERLWSEHFIVNPPSNQIMPNRSAVLDWFRQGMTTRSSYERSIEQVRVDGDIAVVMGAETLKPTDKAPLSGQTVHRRFTNIWKKEGDTWRLWARHANVIPTPAAGKP